MYHLYNKTLYSGVFCYANYLFCYNLNSVALYISIKNPSKKGFILLINFIFAFIYQIRIYGHLVIIYVHPDNLHLLIIWQKKNFQNLAV